MNHCISLSLFKKAVLAAFLFGTTNFFTPAHSLAQSARYSAKNWQLMDLAKDSVYGTSVTRAYNELLKGKKSHQVVVAVIDAGLDTAQEDLQGHVWINKKEIAGNGIDDDHNGYADDVHGWNFLGGQNGSNVNEESLESVREFYRLRRLYSSAADSLTVPAPKRNEYQLWLTLQQAHLKDSLQTTTSIARISPIVNMLNSVDSIWRRILHKDTITIKDINNAIAAKTTVGPAEDSISRAFVNFVGTRQIPDSISPKELAAGGDEFINIQRKKLEGYSVDPDAVRKSIVGDDPFNINDTHYGNNNIAAGKPTHGTHVAGIIAAIRGNGKGMDGITDNVLIMPVRAVPDGDERDKDVALAIRYAVDNGAEVINMSFGKSYSPGKSWVDDAVKYAAKKDVLIIHAAGNDGKDIDTTNDFPSPVYLGTTTKAPDFITVGASTGGPDSLLAASFSNYGHNMVDVFAPGLNIYSTLPGNKYAALSGTSMATPVVAGIAALILEYYPTLTAQQVKYVIEKSVTKFPGDVVTVPGRGGRSGSPAKAKADFSTLSSTGGIINAYNALKLAATLKGKRKIKQY